MSGERVKEERKEEERKEEERELRGEERELRSLKELEKERAEEARNTYGIKEYNQEREAVRSMSLCAAGAAGADGKKVGADGKKVEASPRPKPTAEDPLAGNKVTRGNGEVRYVDNKGVAVQRRGRGRTKHRDIMARLLRGDKIVKIAKDMGYSPQSVAIVVRSQSFQQELSKVTQVVLEHVQDQMLQLRGIAPLAIKFYKDVLSAGSAFDAKLKFNVSKDLLDRVGLREPDRVEHQVNHNIGDVAQLVETAFHQGKVIDVTPTAGAGRSSGKVNGTSAGSLAGVAHGGNGSANGGAGNCGSEVSGEVDGADQYLGGAVKVDPLRIMAEVRDILGLGGGLEEDLDGAIDDAVDMGADTDRSAIKENARRRVLERMAMMSQELENEDKFGPPILSEDAEFNEAISEKYAQDGNEDEWKQFLPESKEASPEEETVIMTDIAEVGESVLKQESPYAGYFGHLD